MSVVRRACSGLRWRPQNLSSAPQRRAQVSRALATAARSSLFEPLDTFSDRHIGPNDDEAQQMLKKVGYDSMEDFIAASVPPSIRLSEAAISNEVIPALSETDLFKRAKALAAANKPFKSYIGMGYHNAVVPPVILRNVCSQPSTSVRIGVDALGNLDYRKPGLVYTVHTLPARDSSRWAR